MTRGQKVICYHISDSRQDPYRSMWYLPSFTLVSDSVQPFLAPWQKLKGHDESPEEVCSCSQLGNLLSQHLGSPLSSPLGVMGVDGDFSTLMENGTLSREGSLQVQLDQVKSQWEYLHHDCCGIMDNLRAINISGDVGFSGDRGISGNTGTSEAIGFYGDISISEDMSFSGSMVISEDTGLSKASTKGADCSKHQWATHLFPCWVHLWHSQWPLSPSERLCCFSNCLNGWGQGITTLT